MSTGASKRALGCHNAWWDAKTRDGGAVASNERQGAMRGGSQHQGVEVIDWGSVCTRYWSWAVGKPGRRSKRVVRSKNTWYRVLGTLHERWGIDTSGGGFGNVIGGPNRRWRDPDGRWEVSTGSGRLERALGVRDDGGTQ